MSEKTKYIFANRRPAPNAGAELRRLAEKTGAATFGGNFSELRRLAGIYSDLNGLARQTTEILRNHGDPLPNVSDLCETMQIRSAPRVASARNDGAPAKRRGVNRAPRLGSRSLELGTFGVELETFGVELETFRVVEVVGGGLKRRDGAQRSPGASIRRKPPERAQRFQLHDKRRQLNTPNVGSSKRRPTTSRRSGAPRVFSRAEPFRARAKLISLRS